MHIQHHLNTITVMSWLNNKINSGLHGRQVRRRDRVAAWGDTGKTSAPPGSDLALVRIALFHGFR